MPNSLNVFVQRPEGGVHLREPFFSLPGGHCLEGTVRILDDHACLSKHFVTPLAFFLIRRAYKLAVTAGQLELRFHEDMTMAAFHFKTIVVRFYSAQHR